MRKLLFILILLPLCSFGQKFVNAYFFKDGSGTTLTDKVGSANGTLAGASLPTWSANGYLSFTGGHGSTSGDYNRVGFTRTTFDYNWNQSFSQILIFRSTKLDATYHFPIINREGGGTTGLWDIRIGTNEAVDFITYAGGATKNKVSAVAVCDGKWHIAIMTYSTNSLFVYVDGVNYALSVDDAITSGGFYSAGSKFVMGAAWNNISSSYYYDYSGDIATYINCNQTLTVADVQNFVNEFNLINQ